MTSLAELFEEKAGDEPIVSAVIGLPGYSFNVKGIPAGAILTWDAIRPYVGKAGLPVYAWTPTRVMWSRSSHVEALPRNPTDIPTATHG